MKAFLHSYRAGHYRLVLLMLLFFGSVHVNAQINIRYVDATRSSGNGQSWANAYPTLKEALIEANSNTAIKEIRVAKGTYYPTGDQTGDDRNATFGIYRRDLAVLGGYPSGGAGPRNWDANPTILSGEINNPNSKTDNSYHVVVVAGEVLPATGNLLIEGFRIHWGRADGGSSETSYNGQGVKRNAGAGIAIVGQGSAGDWLLVRNCIVSGNYAGDIGAGVYVRNTNMNLIGSLISGNYANYCGGVFIHNTVSVASRMRITNCTIVGNHANIDAGGLRISGDETNVLLANTVIHDNSGGVTEKEYISIKDDASYSDVGCLFQWRDNMNPWFTTVIPPGTVNIDGEYWPLFDRASALNERGIDNVSDLGEYDLKYNPRVACITDIGAYEFRKHPNIVGQPQSTSICHGQNASFSVSLAGVTATYIEWEEKKANSGTFRTLTNSGIYSGVNSTTLTLTNVPYDYQHNYNDIYNGSTFRCVMWNEQCSKVISAEVVLTVRQPMHITVDPRPSTTCAGQSVTFSSDALNATGFQWEYDDGTGFKNVPATNTYTGRTSKNLTINPVTAQMNNYLYRVKVSSLCSGTKTSESARLTVPTVSSISQQPTVQTVCVGANASFSVQGVGRFQWQYDDGSGWKNLTNAAPYSNVLTSTLTITSVSSQLNTYKYRAKVDGDCNSVTSSAAVLNVNSVASIVSNPVNQTVCASSDAIFSVQASNAGSYQWQYNDGTGFKNVPEGGSYSGGTTPILQITSTTVQLNSYQYRVVVKAPGGCELTSGSATLTVNPLPVFNTLLQSKASCGEESVTFTADASHAESYHWYYNSGNGFELVEERHGFDGVGTSALTVPAVSVSLNNHQFRCDIVNACVSDVVKSNVATLYVSNIRYVKFGATGSGGAWTDASGDIQQMINESCDGGEVWVAAGTYLPTRIAGDGIGDRDRAFVLRKGVKIFGGFTGTEIKVEERNLTLNRSVLSGDFNGNDIISGRGNTLSISGNRENAFHVLIAAGDMKGVELNGFTITGGNSYDNTYGQIRLNGEWIQRDSGGGIVISNAGNNKVLLNNIIFYANAAVGGGGIIIGPNSSLELSNVLFSHNKAALAGGLYNSGSSLAMRHVTMAGNYSLDGVLFCSGPTQLENCIVWGNSYGVTNSYGFLSYSHSLIQEFSASGTNLGSDPFFLDPGKGDYRLQPCSPAINAGDPATTGGFDLVGNPRVQLGRVDMGAYEASSIAGYQSTIASTGNSSATAYQLSSGITFYASDCNTLLLSVEGSGNHPVEGNTRARIWITPTEGFVGRRYEISPENEADQATGRITLYFTQADFNAYNQPGRPGLPADPTDETGIKNLRIQKRSGSSSDNTGDPSSYPGTVTMIDPVDSDIVWNASQSRWEVTFDVTGFSGFFAYAVDNSALPVLLADFNAEVLEENVQLSWQTTEELNASHFDIERSDNGTSWTTIGQLKADGNRTTLQEYQYLDRSPLSGINYYRLKTVDLDDSFAYSRMVSARLAEPTETVVVYPTIVESGRVTVRVSGDGHRTTKMMDLNGREMVLRVLDHSGERTVFDVRHLIPGVYLVVVHGHQLTVKRFVIK